MRNIIKSFKSILKKILNSSIGDVIASAVKVSPLSFIRLACGFLRSKVSAIIIGVAGVGVLGQANQFLLLITTLGSLGMANSFMQQISSYKEKNDLKNLRLVKGTVLTSQSSFLFVLILGVAIFLKPITFFFFNTQDPIFSNLILAISFFGVFNVIASNYIEGFFTSYLRFDLYVKASSIVTILNFIVFIPAVYFWKVNGGLISIISGEIFLFVVFLYYVLKIESLKNIFLFRFNKEIFRLTFTDGIINLLCAFFASSIGLLLRQLVIKDAGEFKSGIYQFCLSITAYYTPFLTNLLWAKYFPLISSKKITDETQVLIKDTLVFIVVAGSLVTGCVMIFADVAIQILATKEFISAKQYLPIQFIGDFWYFIFYVYSVFLLAMRYTKQYLITWVLFLSLQYVLSISLVNFWGLNGVISGYTISSIFIGLVSLYFFNKTIKEKAANIYYIITISFVFVVLEALLTLFFVNIIFKLILLAIWAYWFAKPIISNKLKH